ncbi:MAG: pyridoxal phosphate-dependent aminotransferase family protein [Deltaproteobacteria bacterium]|nr:pyridoxal phosphate-dependent aminotransferase family protein [Deltaproteobacteria bacterium]
MIRELKQELEQLQALKLLRELHPAVRLNGGLAEIKGKRVVDFTSWDFLNLSFDPRVKRSAQKRIEESGIAASSPRLSTGSTDVHASTELRLSKFLGTDSALLFSSKNQALLTLITSLLTERDVVLLDELSQSPASDAAFLVNAQATHFDSQKPESLEAELEKQRFARRKLIVIETVSSITGKPVDLPRLLLVAKKFDADVVLDESFAIGGFGIRGSGLSDGLILRDGILCVIADLSIGLACYGAAIAGSKVLSDYLLSRSRTFSTETAFPHSIAAAVDTALDIVELQPMQRESLLLLSAKLQTGLSELGFLPAGTVRTPIVSLQFSKRSLASEFAASVFQRGFLVDVVPRGTQFNDSAIVRMVLRSSHSDKQIEQFLQSIADIKSRLPKK